METKYRCAQNHQLFVLGTSKFPNTEWFASTYRFGKGKSRGDSEREYAGMDFDLTPLGERRPRIPLQRKVKQVKHLEIHCVIFVELL